MSAPKLMQGQISPPKAHFLPIYHVTQITASGDDVELGRVVLPCRCHVLRIDYDLTVAGTTGDVDDLKAVIGADTISEAADLADGAGIKNGSLAVTTPLAKSYPAGTVVQVLADTAADTTIEAVCLTITILPVVP